MRGSNPTVADRANRFYTTLRSPKVPRGIHVMNPYEDPRVRRYLRAFLAKFHGDTDDRALILGINPGRFGAGITGITFTDPVALADFCGIENHLGRRRELSSVFVYDVIARLGGPAAFFRRFFLTAICPLGFTKRGVNVNYYDDPKLARAVTPFIVETLRRQIAIARRTDVAFVLGTGRNYQYIRRLNEEHGFFGRLQPLEHPRFILQYRRRRLEDYLRAYAEALGAA